MTVESLLAFIIILAVIGLIVGAVARVLVPGPTSMGVLATIGAGIAGAFIGGFVGRLLFGPSLTSGWSFVLSVLAAIGVVWLVNGRHRSYGYRRDAVVYDGGYDEPVYRRRRFF